MLQPTTAERGLTYSKVRTLLPLFFLLLAIIIQIPQIHAPFKNSVKVDCTVTTSCTSTNLSVSTGDLILVHTACYTTGTSTSPPTDSLGNTFAFVINQANNPVHTIYSSFSATNGNDAVTVSAGGCTSASGTLVFSFSFETFSGIAGIGQTAKTPTPLPTYQGCSTSCTDSLSIVTQASSILYETFSITASANTNVCPSSISSTTGGSLLQTSCDQLTSSSFTFGTLFKQLVAGGSNTMTISFSSTAQFNAFSHMIVELTVPQSSLAFTTNCFGNCGSPPITLVNTNSTHSINFNQSLTLFYEFQSTLNGFILNSTVNLSKNYLNGQQVSLGIYEVNCNAGTTPFSSSCPGQLKASLVSNKNPTKGQLSLVPVPISVSNGQWVAIAVSGVFSGLDLNDTNTNVSLFQQNGNIPTLLNNGVSFTTCSCKMGLWTWISGNIVVAPPPITSVVNCGADFLCTWTLSITALTPANPTVGALLFGIIYSIVTIFILLAFTRWISTGMDLDHPIEMPGGVYILVFWSWETLFLSLVGATAFIIAEFLLIAFAFTLYGVGGRLTRGRDD